MILNETLSCEAIGLLSNKYEHSNIEIACIYFDYIACYFGLWIGL